MICKSPPSALRLTRDAAMPVPVQVEDVFCRSMHACVLLARIVRSWGLRQRAAGDVQSDA
jgi:hypothetical protein